MLDGSVFLGGPVFCSRSPCLDIPSAAGVKPALPRLIAGPVKAVGRSYRPVLLDNPQPGKDVPFAGVLLNGPGLLHRLALLWGQEREAYGQWAGGHQRPRPRLRAVLRVLAAQPRSGPSPSPGVTSGRWIGINGLWIRLGSRDSWQDEDLDAEMIKPVEP